MELIHTPQCGLLQRQTWELMQTLIGYTCPNEIYDIDKQRTQTSNIYRDKWYEYLQHKSSPSLNELSASHLYQFGDIVKKSQQHNHTIQWNGYMHAEIEQKHMHICQFKHGLEKIRLYVTFLGEIWNVFYTNTVFRQSVTYSIYGHSYRKTGYTLLWDKIVYDVLYIKGFW